MPQTITELTLLSPTPDDYILYHHIIKNKDYFSLKSKDNLRSHFVFKKLEHISINNVVFETAIELINAFNETFNTNPQNTETNFTGQAYVIWTGVGFIYDVIYPTYYIQGVLYPAGTEQITLDAADATNPRQDVIAVDATGPIKVTGIPEANPSVPTVDLATSIIITTILVPENATTPPGTANENIYLDNAEWTGTASGVIANFDHTNNVFNGTKCISLPSFAVSNYIELTKSGTVNVQDYRELVFRLRLGSTFSTSSNITFSFEFGSIKKSTTVSLIHGRYGFDRTIIGSYQYIIIPLTAFSFTSSDFNKLKISKTVGTASSLSLDSILLTSNSTGGNTNNAPQNTITSIVTDQGISNATKSNDSVKFTSPNDGLIITSYINKEIRFTSLFTSSLKTLYDIAYSWISTNGGNVTSHLSRTDNPHAVTKSQVGLGNVDNTSDINKPVSTAQATADTAILNSANSYTDSRVSSVYRVKGSVANYASLPSSGQVTGDVWNLTDTDDNYVWTGTIWDKLGTTVDISVKENTSNKTATVIGNETSNSLYLNILGAVTYFQQKFTDSIFGTFILGLNAKSTPIDADCVSIVDSADSNKAKKTTFTQLKAFLKTYYDTQYTSITAIQVPKTYFINTATGNNATGVFEDATKPFASIDYVNANFTIQDNDIFYLQGTGQTYAINGQLQAKKQSFKADSGSTNILDFSSNANTNAMVAGGSYNIVTIDMPNGVLRCERSGGTGVIFGGTVPLEINVKEIYWNTSTKLSTKGNFLCEVQADKISSRVSDLFQFIGNDIIVQEFVCLAAGAGLVSYGKSAKINLISGSGSFALNSNNDTTLFVRYIIGDVIATGGINFGVYLGGIDVTFDNSSITTFSLAGSPPFKIIKGNIRSITTVSGNLSNAKFINFTANLGNGNMTLGNIGSGASANVTFENCSIKSTNSPIIITAGAFSNVLELKNCAFEVVNAVPLVTGGAGGTNTLKIAGVSTNATLLSDQSGTGVTVTQFTNY